MTTVLHCGGAEAPYDARADGRTVREWVASLVGLIIGADIALATYDRMADENADMRELLHLHAETASLSHLYLPAPNPPQERPAAGPP